MPGAENARHPALLARWFDTPATAILRIEAVPTQPIDGAVPVVVLRVVLRSGRRRYYQWFPPEGEHRDAVTPEMALADLWDDVTTSQQDIAIYRRLDAGPNREVEILRELTRLGSRRTYPLLAWADLECDDLHTTSCAVFDREPAAVAARRHIGHLQQEAPHQALAVLRGLGETIASVHRDLADVGSPPRPIDRLHIALLAATIDERLAVSRGVLEASGKRAEVRALAEGLSGGLAITRHGDLTLDNVVFDGGWRVTGWQGRTEEPAPQRRALRSPLADLAALMTSLRRHLSEPFGDNGAAAVLIGYLDTADSRLLPGDEMSVRRMLRLFEIAEEARHARFSAARLPIG